MSSQNYQYAIVVGASSGMGAELVRQLAASGCRVAAVARRKDALDKLAAEHGALILPFKHDVHEICEIPGLFQKMTLDLGGLDLFIYCAGAMPEVGPQEYDIQKDEAMIDVNITGAVAWLDQAAVRFGNVGHGTMVGIGSVAGDRGRCGQPVYNASKAFLATYMEALRNRLHRKGVKVVLIKPGPTQTEMTAELNLKGAMPVATAASLILAKSRKAGEHYLKFTHKVAFLIIRNIPSPIFRKLSI